MRPLGASYLTISSKAFQTNAQGGHNANYLEVLCGDNPPTIVDGYGQWTIIPRPLRQGLTVPQGFNPAKLKIEVRFGVWDGRFQFHGWDTRPIAAQYVEDSIDSLHWMAGGNELGGPSPVVWIDSYRLSAGKTVPTDLMPKQYRGVPWIIDSGINWNDSLRDRQGSRIYQEADFTVTGYTIPTGGPPAPTKSAASDGGFFKTNAQVRTTFGIASSSSAHVIESYYESLARTICKDPRNNPCRGTRLKLERRGIHWEIPPAVDVWVPTHTI